MLGAALYLIGPNSGLVLRIVSGFILVIAWIVYFGEENLIKANLKKLILIAFVLAIFFPFIQSLSQYLVWRSSGFTQAFLSEKTFGILNFSGGYFLYYIWSRFWFPSLLGILVAFGFYKSLQFLKNYRERFFEEGELELGFLIALLVGWPLFIVFLAFSLILIVIISVVNQVLLKQKLTTFGLPFLLAAAAILLFGPYFMSLFGLWVLKP